MIHNDKKNKILRSLKAVGLCTGSIKPIANRTCFALNKNLTEPAKMLSAGR